VVASLAETIGGIAVLGAGLVRKGSRGGEDQRGAQGDQSLIGPQKAGGPGTEVNIIMLINYH
jgi:hypothetical protein